MCVGGGAVIMELALRPGPGPKRLGQDAGPKPKGPARHPARAPREWTGDPDPATKISA